MSSAEDQHRFIEEILNRTGWSQTDLAHRAGLDPSTLSKFLTKGRDGHALRASTMKRISHAVGPTKNQSQMPPANGFSESEVMHYVFDSNTDGGAVFDALRASSPNIDAWILNSRALEGLGYHIGDILFVGLSETPRPGDVVCAQIYDWEKGRADTVFRLYLPPALVSATTEAGLLKPFLLADKAIVIKGVVLHTLRSRK